MARTCYKCGNAESTDGSGAAELRPYGPGGQPVCFTCAFSTPEMKAQTDQALESAFDSINGPIVLTCDGPKPLTPESISDVTSRGGAIVPPLTRKN